MLGTPIGLILLVAALLAVGLAGIAACWAAWPRTSNTSPLAALLSFVWSCTYIVSALLAWRRSRLAAPAFLGAMALLLPLSWFLFPGSQVPFLAILVITLLLALLGHRYLRNAGEPVT